MRTSSKVGARCVLLSAALLGSCGGGDPGVRWRDSTASLVVVAVSSLRHDHLGLYGYARPTSPHLDDLARGAFVFRHVQAPAPWTAPSLISLMTSLRPDTHGVRYFPDLARLNDDSITLAELLRAAGCATGAFTEGAYARRSFGLDSGFDVFRDDAGDASPGRGAIAANVGRAVEWLRGRADERFFLFLHTYEPALPFGPPAEYVRRFSSEYDEHAEHAGLSGAIEEWNAVSRLDREAARLLSDHWWHCRLDAAPPARDEPALRAAAAELGFPIGGLASEPRAADRLAGFYDADLAYLDAELARLWAALDELGRLDDTIIVVAGTHGEELGERGQVGHGEALTEEALRTALVVRLPERYPRPYLRPLREMVRTIDVMPTVLELMDATPDPFVAQGRSLVPAMRGDRFEVPALSTARTVSPTEDKLSSIRSERWRYTYDDRTEEGRLFDLFHDPESLVDVSSERPAVAGRLYLWLQRQKARDHTLGTKIGWPRPADVDAEAWAELRGLGYVP